LVCLARPEEDSLQGFYAPPVTAQRFRGATEKNTESCTGRSAPQSARMTMNQAPSPAPLERWLTGPRFAALPARDGSHRAPALSFEFFPPSTEVLEQQLWHCIRRLEPLAPRFVSVTYGAGGSTQARTHATVSRIVRETTLVPAAHLTCVGASRAEVDEVARR